MKIALVCPYNVGRAGGVFEIIKNLHNGLSKRGHDVHILTPQPREWQDRPAKPDDGIIFLGAGTEVRSPTHTSLQISMAIDTPQIEKLLDKHHFDVINFHEPWVPVVSRQILSRSQAVNVGTFHAVVPETIVSRSVVKVVTPYALSILKYLDALTAVSDAAAGYVRSLTDQPVSIIPNAIDLEVYRPVAGKRDPNIKTILFVGRLEKRKGVKYLLKAFAILAAQHDDIRLIIAGDGPDRSLLVGLCAELGITKQVEFKGYVDEVTKLKLLSCADLFCSPALYGESFGIVLLEAMAMSTVTVAGNNSGYVDLMKDVGQLSIVNPRDSVEFARRLALMLYSESLRRAWLSWSAKYVQDFSFAKITKQYEDVYAKAIESRQR